MDRRNARRSARGRRRAPANWFTKVRALLAGALVLGVGASLTLAAWTDTETAQATFTASSFGVEGSTDGTTYAEHPAAGPAALAFTINPGALSPGSVVYARFLVRTTAGTSVTGNASLSGAAVTGTGLGSYLRYGVRTIPAASACNATTFAAGAQVVASNSALGTAGSGTQPLATAGASPVSYCFAVTLPAGTVNAAQGLNATAKWTVTATSTS